MFTGFYCRGNREKRTLLWNDFKECRISWDEKWVIGGDFNMTLRKEKRSGNNFLVAEANEFKEAMERLGMADLPLSKGQ